MFLDTTRVPNEEYDKMVASLESGLEDLRWLRKRSLRPIWTYPEPYLAIQDKKMVWNERVRHTTALAKFVQSNPMLIMHLISRSTEL